MKKSFHMTKTRKKAGMRLCLECGFIKKTIKEPCQLCLVKGKAHPKKISKIKLRSGKESSPSQKLYLGDFADAKLKTNALHPNKEQKEQEKIDKLLESMDVERRGW